MGDWGVVLLQAVGGLVVAAVLKYAEKLLKGFGNAVSIVLSCLLSAIFLKEFEPDRYFVFGTILVLVATTLYSIGVPQAVQILFNSKLGSLGKSKVDVDIEQKRGDV